MPWRARIRIGRYAYLASRPQLHNLRDTKKEGHTRVVATRKWIRTANQRLSVVLPQQSTDGGSARVGLAMPLVPGPRSTGSDGTRQISTSLINGRRTGRSAQNCKCCIHTRQTTARCTFFPSACEHIRPCRHRPQRLRNSRYYRCCREVIPERTVPEAK